MRTKAAFVLSSVMLGLSLIGCSSSSAGTSFWKVTYTNGTTDFMSVVTDAQGNVSGWAQYLDGKFQHFDGTKSSDGTYSVTAFTGETLQINGSTMTATLNDGNGTAHWTETSESAYKAAGGPG